MTAIVDVLDNKIFTMKKREKKAHRFPLPVVSDPELASEHETRDTHRTVILTFWAYCGTAFLDAASAGKNATTSEEWQTRFVIESKGGKVRTSA